MEGLDVHLVAKKQLFSKIPASSIQGTLNNPDTIGVGALRFGAAQQASGSATGVANGTTLLIEVECRPTIPVLTGIFPYWALYVDNDDTAAWLWPDGSSLTSSNRPRVNWGPSLAKSSFSDGVYVYDFAIKNESGGNQDYFFYFQYIVPVMGGGTSA